MALLLCFIQGRADAVSPRPFSGCNSVFGVRQKFAAEAQVFDTLNQAFERLIDLEIQKLSPAKQIEFHRWVRRAKLEDSAAPVQVDGKVYFEYGSVHPKIKIGPGMETRGFLLWRPVMSHPMGLVAAAHEMIHIRQYLGNPIVRLVKSLADISGQRGNLRDETEALAVNYDLLREGFKVDDLETLKQNYKYENIEEFEKRFTDDKGVFREPAINATPLMQSQYEEYVTLKLNKAFIEMLQNAFSKTRDDFVEDYLKPYR